MTIRVHTKGSFKKTLSYLQSGRDGSAFRELERYGQLGVAALASATPVDSGETANSWDYRVTRRNGRYSIEWFNTHVVDGVNIAIILQYGHGTGTGGFVRGQNYINPAIQPIFDRIADDVWRTVSNG